MQLALNVNGRLCLHSETDQTQHQKEGGICVSPSSLQLCDLCWISLMKCGPPAHGWSRRRVVRYMLVVAVLAQQRLLGLTIIVTV